MTLRIRPWRSSGADSTAETALASLRMRVFREWPYLYDGDLEYERRYLQRYLLSERSLVLLAHDGDQLVGASTALPLIEAEADMRAPFEAAGVDLSECLYFGESVVLPAYRGQGLGVAFFEQREQHARDLGLSRCTFCAVLRPDSHPARPLDYRGNEAFWLRRGYTPTDLQCGFDWQDLGDSELTRKQMRFWTRDLDQAPSPTVSRS